MDKQERDKRFEVTTTYTINYKTKNPAPIKDVIESLRNVEAILYRTPKFIEAAYKDLKVVDVQVYVGSLQTGSLREDFIVKYVFRSRKNYEKAKEVVGQILEDNEAMKILVALGVGSMVTFGAMTALGTGNKLPSIEAYNNTIVNIGGEVKLTADDISGILSGIRDKKALAKESVGVVSVAKADPDAEIEMSGVDALTMRSNVLREMPEDYTPPEPDTRDAHYPNAPLIIYASDREKKNTVWAGLVPGIVDKRVRFELMDDVDPVDLHGKTDIRAEIKVIKKYSPSTKKYEPKRVEIIALHK